MTWLLAPVFSGAEPVDSSSVVAGGELEAVAATLAAIALRLANDAGSALGATSEATGGGADTGAANPRSPPADSARSSVTRCGASSACAGPGATNVARNAVR